MSTTRVQLPASPYRGLTPFGESELDALFFFGRERDTELVTANLIAARLTVLYGPSGVGKSSLLRAGVARALRALPEEPAVVVFDDWTVAAEAPFESALAEAESGRDVYLILDQLEEAFLYHGSSDALARGVGDLVARRDVRVRVALGIRDDALAQLDALKAHVPALFGNYLRLDHLDRESARAAIEGPVRRWNELADAAWQITVEPELVDAVLHEVTAGRVGVGGAGRGVVSEDNSARRIETPYLQLVMQRLWDVERAASSTALRLETLRRLGGASTVVREHLEGALGTLAPEQKEAAARMFDHLVTPSGTKIAHGVDDLAEYAHATREELAPVLRTLAESRILRPVAGEAAASGGAFEIFHDVLADAVLEWRTKFEAQRGVELARQEAERRRRRAVAVATAALGALVLVTLVALFALTQRHEARKQERTANARALAATALAQLDADPELSLVLARDAARLSSTPQVEDVLRRSLIASRVREVARIGKPVASVGFTPDGRAVALTRDGAVAVVDPSSGRVVHRFATGTPRAQLDPTGHVVLAFGARRRARLYDTRGRLLRTLQAPPVLATAWARTGAVLATLHRDRVLRLWRAGPRPFLTIDLRGVPVAAAVSRDGSLVAVATGGKESDVYDGQTGALRRRLREGAVVTRLLFSPGGRLLASVKADKTVTLQDVRTAALFDVFRGHVGQITDVDFSPRATRIATASTDGTARVWRVGSRGGLVALLVGHRNFVTSVRFSRDGETVVTSSTDRTARVWKTETGDPLAVLAGHGDSVTSAAFDRTGDVVATGSDDGTVRFWDPVAQPRLHVVLTRPWPVAAARYAHGPLVVARRGAVDVSVSDGETGTAVGRHVTFGPRTFLVPVRATGVAVSPSGRTIAVAGADGRVRVYDRGGRLRTTLGSRGAALTRDSFSPDGTEVAAGSTDATAKIWNVRTRKLVRVLRGHRDDVTAVRWSADGAQLVTSSRDHDARTWDAATGDHVHVLRGHFAKVSDAAFSPDGRWVVTAGPGTAGLWDARSGDLVFFLRGHVGALTSASFDATGRRILTTGVDGTVRTYTCDICVGIDGLERLADRRLAATHRHLTAAERARYAP